ncbi:hypothetical protein [Pectinatus frisingensis]|uniref:hypothetical protein n=2 Tax=Pectinatus frisingensis TaxID=865 RepID=UPI0018C4C79F|nr:hypothetical protein [Pectinatus frisingensis]
MFKIGVISASTESAQHMIELAESILKKDSYKYIPYIYNSFTALKNIMIQHSNQVDGLLFTGPNPYYFAKKYINNEQLTTVCSVISGYEIYKYILEYLYKNMNNSLRISMDCPIQEIEIFKESLNMLKIPHKDFFLQQYNIPCIFDDVIKKHRQLWQSHKIDIIFTTLHAVQMELEKLNIPCKRIEVGINSWRQAIQLLDEKLTGLHFRNSQLGIICIKIKNYDEFIGHYGNYYKLQKLELLLKNNILSLCQTVNGYLIEKNDGYYEIFSSRGSIENHSTEISSFITEIQLNCHVDILCGIGLAPTVFGAQVNAHKALANGHENTQNSIYIIDGEKITEHFGTKNELHYEAGTNKPLLTAKLKTAGVSIQTYNRIIFILQKMSLVSFSATQLAQYLNVTIRNVQRILSGLKEADLVVEIGQETLGKRGRPTKIYRLSDNR